MLTKWWTNWNGRVSQYHTNDWIWGMRWHEVAQKNLTKVSFKNNRPNVCVCVCARVCVCVCRHVIHSI